MTDFTICDCFEVYQYSKELDNDKGVSEVLVHSAKAEEIIEELDRLSPNECFDKY